MRCHYSTGLMGKFLLLLFLASTSYLLNLLSSVSKMIKDESGPVANLSDGTLCSSLSSQFPDSIPPLVHWTSRDGRVHVRLIPIVRTWRRLFNTNSGNRSHPSDGRPMWFTHLQDTRNSMSGLRGSQNRSTRWHFMHWDDKQISELISKHYPHLTQSYSKLVNGLERSDIGRLVVLHHVGGLYVDTDVELLRDPSPLLRPSELLGAGMSANFSCQSAVWSQELPEHALFPFNRPSLISNAVMMSRANHSFLSFVLKHWPSWFEENWAKKTGRVHNDAVFVTGPVMLQTFYDKYTALQPSERPEGWCGNMLADADSFLPIWDLANLPGIVKKACAKPQKLSDLQRQHCKRMNFTIFDAKRIPNSSFTVHKYMHLSYWGMRMEGSMNIASILPIHTCQL